MNKTDVSSKLAEDGQAPRAHAFRQVLVATDFSEGAAQAIARARRVPLMEGATMTLLHVEPPARSQAAGEPTAEASLRKLEEGVASLRKAVAARGDRGVEIKSEMVRGTPDAEIVGLARAMEADLIILGRHGERPVRDILFTGSTASRVIRAAEASVLVVSGAAEHGYQRPVVAVDLEDLEDANRAVISGATRALVAGEVKQATLVHAYHVPFEGFMTPSASPQDVTELRQGYASNAARGMETLRKSVAELGVDWRSVVVRGDARLAIVEVADKRSADLLVVGAHRRSALAHVLLGSVAASILEGAPCDVLVVRASPSARDRAGTNAAVS